jgi:hypothetical protein
MEYDVHRARVESLMMEHEQDRREGADPRNSENGGTRATERLTSGSVDFLERSAELAKPLAELGTRNMERAVNSCKLAGRAAESLAQEATAYGRKSCEDAFAMARSFAEVRSPTDLMRIQSQFAKAALDNAMAFSSNVSKRLEQTASGSDQPAEGPSAADHGTER